MGQRCPAVGEERDVTEQDCQQKPINIQKHTRHKSLDVSKLNTYSVWGEESKKTNQTYLSYAGTVQTDFAALSAARKASDGDDSKLPSNSPCGTETTEASPSDCSGFDFGSFLKYVEDPEESESDRGLGERGSESGGGRTRSLSQGDSPDIAPGEGVFSEQDEAEALGPAVWCLACQDCLIVTGCGDGRIEVSLTFN